jgi:solute:Na+ symporter, SSS family
MQMFASASGLGLLDLGAVILYLLAMLGIGLYFSRRQTSADEYLLGSRGMNPFLVGISLIATLLSTITYLASPGDMIQHGPAFATGVLAMPLWLAVVSLFWIPFFMRYRFTSIYEYAELRFSRTARLCAACMFVLFRLGWMSLIVYTAGRAIAEMTENIPTALAQQMGIAISSEQWFYTLMLLIGITTTGYTFFGGIRAVIWTDFAQFVIMIAGVLLTIGFIWLQTGDGPLGWWHEASQQRHEMITWFSIDPTVERTVFLVVLDTFIWRICVQCSDQVATQRYFSTSGVSSALRSNVVAALADFVILGLLGLLGLALLHYYSHPDRAAAVFGGPFDPKSSDDAMRAFPKFIVHALPQGLAGLVLAALLSAAMSSISSGINSISAVLLTDFRRRPSSDNSASETSLARRFSLLTGLFVTGSAFFVAFVIASDPKKQNIIDLSNMIFNLFVGPLGGLFIAGMFLPWVGGVAALLGTAVGLSVAAVLAFWGDWFDLGTAPSTLLITPLALLATVVIAGLLGFVLSRPDRRLTDGHTWWTRHIAPKSRER